LVCPAWPAFDLRDDRGESMPVRRPQLPLSVRDACLLHLAAAARRMTARTHGARDVHAARRHLKRSNALLAVMKPSIAPDLYAALRADLRRVHGALGAARDLAVLSDALLRVAADGGIRRSALRPLLAGWAGRSRRAMRLSLDAELAATLVAAGATLAAVEPQSANRELRRGLGRLYRQGYAAYVRACERPRGGALHACRKRTQRLSHALDFAEPRLSRRMWLLRRDARLLARLLGDYNDLTQLRRALRQAPIPEATRRLLRDAAGRRRDALREQACERGARVYARRRVGFRCLG
jgi:hypothetical protein